MILPFNANKIEQLVLDPVDPSKKVDGYIWFNKTEHSFKTYIEGAIHVFLTDVSFTQDMQALIDIAVNALKNEYLVTFVNVTKIIIKHNKNNINFTYTVVDEIEKCTLPCALTIIDPNEFHIELVDHVTGKLYMYFA